jgi:hypothetical protein
MESSDVSNLSEAFSLLEIPLVNICLVSGSVEEPPISAEASSIAAAIHLERVEQLLASLAEHMGLTSLWLGDAKELRSHSNATQILLVQSSHCMLFKLVLGEVIGIEMLAITCKQSLLTVLQEFGGKYWKVWQKYALHFTTFL